MFPAPHGAVCGRLLPYVVAVNVRALHERMPESAALHRYDEVAQILTGDGSATADDGVAWVQDLCDALDVPSLGSYGVTVADFPLLIEKATVSSSMQGNPIKLTPDEMGEILARAL
jgi:alcohol dehydrogenase class IV